MQHIELSESDITAFGEKLTAWALDQSPTDRVMLAALLDLALRDGEDVTAHLFTGLPQLIPTTQQPIVLNPSMTPTTSTQTTQDAAFNGVTNLLQTFTDTRNHIISGL
jgi:hypothetical protein